MLIDVHTHIFPCLSGRVAGGATVGLEYGRARMGEYEYQFLPPYCREILHTPEMLIAELDSVGIDKAVLLQGPFFGQCNEYVLKAVRKYPHRLVGGAIIDPWAPASRQEFEGIASADGFRAVKLECSISSGLLGIHPEASLDSPQIKWLWSEIEKSGLVLVLDLGSVGSRSYQTDAVKAIAMEYPGLKIVIAHLAQPTQKVESCPELLRLWWQQIDLGKMHNVCFDTASLPAYVIDEGYPYPSAMRYVRMAIERIGPEKIMWGTDVPTFFVHTTYPQMLNHARASLEFLSISDRELVLGKNAEKFFALTCPRVRT
jgi:predicted TIM-barrel fold metal-dependent hydrolase